MDGNNSVEENLANGQPDNGDSDDNSDDSDSDNSNGNRATVAQVAGAKLLMRGVWQAMRPRFHSRCCQAFCSHAPSLRAFDGLA